MRKTYLWIIACLTAAGLVGCGNESWSSGDRVLVAKCLYDSKLASPNRFDVVVFKYPKEPTKKLVPYNYIKRLLGLPGEFFAIFLGRIYVWTPQGNEENPAPDFDPKNDDAWERDLRDFPDSHAKAIDRFRGGSFQIVRKPPEVLLAMRRIVYDNDFPARDLEGVIPPRWNPKAQSGWKADNRRGFVFAGDGKQTDWLRYQHYVRRPLLNPIGANMKPELIADILSYNTVPRSWNFHEFDGKAPRSPADIPWKKAIESQFWVGDLILEAEVNAESAQGEFRMELSRGPFRFQARFDLASGDCALVKIDAEGKETELDRKPTKLRGAGEHLVRFANVDARLTVWVDKSLPFNDGVAYPPPDIRNAGEKIEEKDLEARRGPHTNDLEPASIGAVGSKVQVHKLRLWRDSYYTPNDRGLEFDNPAWQDPTNPSWSDRRGTAPRIMYIFPGHYLCLGDNSQASSDSRSWGLVPERLLLGRALMVYYPLHRAGLIR
jgi:hypothetical protein